jgi:hypothetical protein
MGKNETISPKIRNEARVSTAPTLTQYLLEFLARMIRQEEEIKRILIRIHYPYLQAI